MNHLTTFVGDPSVDPSNLDRRIRQIVFDVPGVLYDDSEWKRWLFGLLARMGLHSHYAAFFRLWNCEYRNDVWCGRRPFWDALSDFLRCSGLTPAHIEEVVAASRERVRRFDDRIRPFAGVRRTLHDLAGHRVQMVMVSRSPQSAWRLHNTLRQLGLVSCKAEILAPADVSLIENADDYFDWLATKLLYSTEEVAFVGRDRDDLAAAQRIGALTVAFNYDFDATADVYLEQFDQLLEIPRDSEPMLAAG